MRSTSRVRSPSASERLASASQMELTPSPPSDEVTASERIPRATVAA
ncbi:hypothetical protein ACSZOK_09440 [Aeromonas veronii]